MRPHGNEDAQVAGIPSTDPPVSVPVDAPREARGNSGGNAEPSDAELERGILDALRLGAVDVARTLNAQLETRRRTRLPSNVVPLPRKAGRSE